DTSTTFLPVKRSSLDILPGPLSVITPNSPEGILSPTLIVIKYLLHLKNRGILLCDTYAVRCRHRHAPHLMLIAERSHESGCIIPMCSERVWPGQPISNSMYNCPLLY